MYSTTIAIERDTIVPEGIAKFKYCMEEEVEFSQDTQWLNFKMLKEGRYNEVKRMLEQGKAQAFTDGSYLEYEGVGTAAWTITVISKGVLVPGVHDNMSSF